MPTTSAPQRTRSWRPVVVVVLLALLFTACAEDERREIRLTPTSTVETGVRILADNCPGPDRVVLSVRDEVLWDIVRDEAPAEAANGDESDAGDSFATDGALSVDGEQPPGLVEFLVGRTPDDWTADTPLSEPLVPGIRYTIRTEPDDQTIDFSTPDLSPGLLWDGTGNAQFNPDLINVECSEPADVEGFARNVGLLLAFWVTAAAAVMVALILVLFVVTRRFSRVRSVQKRAEREASSAPAGSSSRGGRR